MTFLYWGCKDKKGFVYTKEKNEFLLFAGSPNNISSVKASKRQF
jgi:hypothetical protein